MQALALWDIGVRRWNEKRKAKSSQEKWPGDTINRRDLISIPVRYANLRSGLVSKEGLDREISDKLDKLVAVAQQVRPRS